MKATIAAVLLLFLTAQSVNAITVERIEVVGNVHISDTKIISIFGVRAGDTYRPENVTRGLESLFRTKNFSDLIARYREEGGKAVITITVTEYPRVKRIVIKGNDKIDREDIQGKVLLREGYFARPSIISRDVSAIKELYSEKGYSRAGVEVRRGKIDKDNRIEVTYLITEGAKIKIKHIDFLGNGALDSKALRAVMESKEDRWWRGGDLKMNVLKEDLGRIKQLYGDEGYLDAAIRIEKQVEVDDGKRVDLFIRIDEGQRYFIGSVDWDGNTIFDDEEIADIVVLEEGEPFSLEEIELVQGAINGKYLEQGYIWSRINPERRVKGQTIDLRLNIIENNPASINEIKISGNTKTFETIIRRELRVYPGDKFNLSDVQRSLRDVFLLGYFNGPPQLYPERVSEEGDINLLIEVEEKQTGYFKLGAGFSQLNKLSGFLGITENNFLGRGKSVTLDWEFGRWRRNINLRYTEPHFLGTETTLSVSVFNWIQDRINQQYYTDRRRGFSIQVGHPFPWLDYTRFYTSYRFETVELSDFSSIYPETGVLRQVDWPLNKSAVTFSITRNSTDSPFHPTLGSSSSISAEFSGGPLGGNVGFQRYKAGLSWFRNLFWKFTFHLEMNVAMVDVFGGADEVQDFEKFRLGGNRLYALRGYDFYEVVPEGNDPFRGGRFMTSFTEEIVFPFTNQIYGLIFFDAGNTWNSFSEADLFNLRRGLGVGVRLEMPGLGNLGFDYGYGFDKVGGPGWEPHFAFGTFF
ncbi:MAG: outer membrane protein assembly factor BamA [bacterium]|nr:MAG: outer membrane protein assembly factor BamA [bacterium]